MKVDIVELIKDFEKFSIGDKVLIELRKANQYVNGIYKIGTVQQFELDEFSTNFLVSVTTLESSGELEIHAYPTYQLYKIINFQNEVYLQALSGSKIPLYELEKIITSNGKFNIEYGL